VSVATATAKIDALARWVELTKTYYICVRKSQALAKRGWTDVTAPDFRLPDTMNAFMQPDALAPTKAIAAAREAQPHIPTTTLPWSLERERSGACAPLRQRASEEIVHELRGNLDRIRR
jgi:hypothetical protein